MSFNKICVIGLGYIGLPTASMFALNNKKVIGLEVNFDTVETINSGGTHIVEPGLDKIVSNIVNNGYLKAITIPEPADAFIITVPTPFKNKNFDSKVPDVSYIKDAIKSIAPVLKKGDLIVLESTSPVGTTEKLVGWLTELRSDLAFPNGLDDNMDINVAYCPERVLPGNIIEELKYNERVIGGITSTCSRRAVELYNIFLEGKCTITNARTAELTKLTENSCRDVQIAFANELSMICSELNIDVKELISLANKHPRINILNPGPGVGGHCIAVDPWFIISETKNAKLIKQARLINVEKEEWVYRQVVEKLSDGNVLIIYGLAFKPNIDDLRNSPSVNILKKLKKTYNEIKVVEPNVNYSQVEGIENISIKKADEIKCSTKIKLVNHDAFRNINFDMEFC